MVEKIEYTTIAERRRKTQHNKHARNRQDFIRLVPCLLFFSGLYNTHGVVVVAVARLSFADVRLRFFLLTPFVRGVIA